MKKLIGLVFTSLLLVGCASSTQYQWGGYEDDLYAGYKDPQKMTALRTNLEKQISTLESKQLKVAPGLYAELGTLYLQAGLTEQAIAMYKKERDLWPESKGLMSAMIQNLERKQLEKNEAKK